MIDNLSVFLGFTIILMGGAGFMTGQAVASSWRPVWQVIVYSLLLGLVDRFLVFALFGGSLLSASGYVLDSGVLLAIALTGFRLTQVRRMVDQYPWRYQRRGIFSWREKDRSGTA